MLKTEDWILPSVSISISSFSAVGKIMAVLMQSRWPGFTFDPSSPSYLFSLVLRVAGKETTWMSLLASVYILPKVTGTNWHILRSRNQGKIRISWKNKYTLMSAGPGLVVGAVKQLQNSPPQNNTIHLCNTFVQWKVPLRCLNPGLPRTPRTETPCPKKTMAYRSHCNLGLFTSLITYWKSSESNCNPVKQTLTNVSPGRSLKLYFLLYFVFGQEIS